MDLVTFTEKILNGKPQEMQENSFQKPSDVNLIVIITSTVVVLLFTDDIKRFHIPPDKK